MSRVRKFVPQVVPGHKKLPTQVKLSYANLWETLTDVIIFKLLSQKLAKILANLTQNTASLCIKIDHNFGFQDDPPIFRWNLGENRR
jgi:hypothetical protein